MIFMCISHDKYWRYFSGDTGRWFNIKMSSYQYRKSHGGDKTILWSSYLHNGISYTGKMTSLYWIRTQVFFFIYFFINLHFSQVMVKCKQSVSHELVELMLWWRHQMETFSALLALCAGNSPVTGEFSLHRSLMRSFDVFFHLCQGISSNDIDLFFPVNSSHRAQRVNVSTPISQPISWYNNLQYWLCLNMP